MRILVLTTLAMLAFAANSLLNRAALDARLIDPVGFSAIRVAAGALVLAIAMFIKQKRFFATPPSLLGPIGLLAYMLAFSYAYLALDAGYGALLLFGTVQLTMFLASFRAGQKPLPAEVLGSVIAFGGLAYLMIPDLQIGGAVASLSMVVAGIGWAFFTLAGKKADNPLTASAACFVAIAPVTILAWPLLGDIHFTTLGVALAVISGAVTSGIGYLIWYSVLPKLAVPTAALVQLTVPIIAIVGGVVLLGETASIRLIIAAGLVCLGVVLGIEARRRVGS